MGCADMGIPGCHDNYVGNNKRPDIDKKKIKQKEKGERLGVDGLDAVVFLYSVFFPRALPYINISGCIGSSFPHGKIYCF